MTRHKGKEKGEEGSSPTKITQKWAFAKTKEIQKMFQWIQMGSKER
jgi:hypothetical protein